MGEQDDGWCRGLLQVRVREVTAWPVPELSRDCLQYPCRESERTIEGRLGREAVCSHVTRRVWRRFRAQERRGSSE